MEYPEARILIFCKAPVPGQVKTRLIPLLGATAATDLHTSLALQIIEQAVTSHLCPVELWCSPRMEHPFFQYCADRYPLTLHRQRGPDLGRRMAHALRTTLRVARYPVIIGTDCPFLGPEYLREALRNLHAGREIVIGPAEDGGYTLLGSRRVVAELFRNVDWGTSVVLDQTRAKIAALGLRYQELPELWDVDRPEDVQRMQQAGIMLRMAWKQD